MADFKLGDKVTFKARLSGRQLKGKIVRESAAGGFYGVRENKTGFEFLMLSDELEHAH